LTRPCLSARKQARREGTDATFPMRMGDSCIKAAKTVVDFLPDELSVHFIYDQVPWWCIVHHMMQAVSIFLLGLSYPSSTSQDSALLIHYVRKVIRRLQVMQDPVAERAYHVAMEAFESVSRRYAIDISDMYSGHEINPSMAAAYAPAQFFPPTSSGTTGMTTYPAFTVYNGRHVFNDQYHMAR
jgi:hypothetical protein